MNRLLLVAWFCAVPVAASQQEAASPEVAEIASLFRSGSSAGAALVSRVFRNADGSRDTASLLELRDSLAVIASQISGADAEARSLRAGLVGSVASSVLRPGKGEVVDELRSLMRSWVVAPDPAIRSEAISWLRRPVLPMSEVGELLVEGARYEDDGGVASVLVLVQLGDEATPFICELTSSGTVAIPLMRQQLASVAAERGCSRPGLKL